MIRLQSILVISLILLALASCKERAKRAKVYHDIIAVNTALVIDSVIEFGDAVHSGYKSSSLDATEQYLNLINRTLTTVDRQGDFEKDASLRETASGLLRFYKGYVEGNFIPYFNSLENDSLNEFQILVADSLHRKMMEEEVPHWSAYNNAEKKFSDKFDIGAVR